MLDEGICLQGSWHKYGMKVLNFYLALAASGDKKAFEYVSGNLVGVGLHHMQCIVSKLRITPFISLDEEKMVFHLQALFDRIQSKDDHASSSL